ncbi:MAG TPA: D-ribose pyranase [Clostridiaceae bacterium]|jgi:D-ribose pyranase|nr:D-ribose pyranase [Clostridiaceae bacterium]HBF78096.1 D-ribose pyranase [Clostridiaceae bacterium]HBG39193.1 D-ribose pyranase [Clostridiaceae bacterium]HBN28125.1 D-ribose pyranase [Clostridiaceae bacterium]HBX48283.1 D-ribose pyranase [Clostridiaceae bacterium]
MLKTGILNPQIANVLASTGHKDMIVVSDAGLPIPKGVERIDLAWKANEPGYIEVLEEILKYIVVEKAILAEELKVVSPKMHEKILETLPKGIEIEYVPHVELKETTKSARAIIRTGEFTPYPSVILVAGCAY